MANKSTFISFLRSKSRMFIVPAMLGTVLSLPALPASAADKAANVYGYLGYFSPKDENDHRAGWYKINTADGSTENIWLDQIFGMFGTYFNVGYTRNNKLCGYYGNASQYFYMEFDLTTGNKLLEREIDVQGENAHRQLMSGAYNRADDCVYGFAANVDRTRYFLVKAKASDPTDIEIVREVPENFIIPVSCCFSSADNHIYGVDQLGDLIRVDIHGNFQWVGAFADMSGEAEPNIAGWEAGMTYSPRDKAFIWNRHAPNYDTWLYKIDARTYKWSKLKDLAWADQYTILDCTDTDGEENGPIAPELVSKDFADGSRTGKLVFRMPTKLANGQDAPASMKWTALDGVSSQAGTAAPGEEVTVNFTEIDNGEHNFSIRAEADGMKGASLVCNTWIGFDNPLAPTDVTLSPLGEGKFNLSWKAPEGGAHGSYVNASNVRYTVLLDGKAVANSLSECSTTVELPTDAETRRYSFQVVASADGMDSEAGRSNYVFTGRGYNMPLYITPTQEQSENMTYINVDGDKSSWNYMLEIGYKTPAFYTGKDWDNKGNDWLITPPVWVDDTSKKYNISFEVKYHNPLKAEEFYEVWLGTAPTEDDIRTIRVAPKTRVNDNSYYTASYDFEAPATGTYYLGIRYVGDADQGGVYVRNIAVTKTDKNSGITAAESSGLTVRGGYGEIVISSHEALTAGIYTADGRRITTVSVDGERSVKAEAGIYLVKTGEGNTYKIHVK